MLILKCYFSFIHSFEIFFSAGSPIAESIKLLAFDFAYVYEEYFCLYCSNLFFASFNYILAADVPDVGELVAAAE